MDALFRLDGKVAAIVGAGAGIGAAVARGCSAQGARVVCLDVNEAAVASVSQSIAAAGADSASAVVDVRDGAAVAAAFQRIAETHGRLDIVVCTAGINVRKTLLDYSDDLQKGGFKVTNPNAVAHCSCGESFAA